MKTLVQLLKVVVTTIFHNIYITVCSVFDLNNVV